MILVRAAPDGAGEGHRTHGRRAEDQPRVRRVLPVAGDRHGRQARARQRARLLPRPRRQGRGTGRPVGREGPGDAELHRGAGDRPERVRAAVRRASGPSRPGREDQAGAGRAAVHPGAGDLRGPGGGRAVRQPGAAGRAADPGQGAGQARGAVLGRHRVGVQVDHLVLRRPARRRGAGPAERGRRPGGSSGAARGAGVGRDHGGQPGGAGVPAGRGGDDPHRVSPRFRHRITAPSWANGSTRGTG